MSLMGVLCSMVIAQNKIDIKGEQCTHCNMVIKDPLFAAMAINENQQHTFDAIECLVNFLKENDETSYTELWIADYGNGGKMMEANSATYLKSKKIASPMGAYISGFGSQEVARRIQKENGGELYNWKELKELFKNSRFGMLNHPTHHHHTPGAYAPIGVMGDHLHHKGGFMVSLRYMDMNMEGNLQESEEIEDMSVFQNYMVAPQSMSMRMYMFGVMYAPSDKLTLMVMQNFIENKMELQNMMGMSFSTSSKGLGDLKISALYGLVSNERSSFHLNAAVNIPVGAVDNIDNTPMMDNMKLPYPMQLGSGTVDFTLGGTYKGSISDWSWGLQPLASFRTGDNSEGYRFGNQFDLTGWVSYDVARWMSLSGRFSGSKMGELDGQDDDLNPMMAPPANTLNSGYTKVRSYLGANWSFGNQPVWRDFKVGIEYGLPIYQDVNGIQMRERATINAGVRYSL